MLVQGLEPNTKYEFAVRLHVDQLSSPWSPVVYRSTLPEGKEKKRASLCVLSKCLKICATLKIYSVCHLPVDVYLFCFLLFSIFFSFILFKKNFLSVYVLHK